jgi:hypothetical protein
MASTTVTVTSISPTISVASLSEVLDEVAAKREAEVIRFRTCCADPRASK